MAANQTTFRKGDGRPKGRKSKAEELGLRALLAECFTEQDRREVLTKLVEDAKSPQPRLRQSARELLLAYTYGKPVQRQEVEATVDSFIVDLSADADIGPTT